MPDLIAPTGAVRHDLRLRDVRELPADRLWMNEIFYSIQGESTRAGRPCTFVRLSVCHLRCVWCDSAYTFHEGYELSVDEALAQVESLGCRLVELTGGEPLLQAGAIPLMSALLERGYEVLLETSGSLSIADVPRAVVKIVDLKPPASGMVKKNHLPNLDLLAPHDEVKAVIGSRVDYEWARDLVRAHRLTDRVAAVLFSPVWGAVEWRELAEWILTDRLDVRFQLQLHKLLWEPTARGV